MSSPQGNGSVSQPNGDGESSPLLGGKDLSANRVHKRMHKHMTAKVSKNWADIVLLGCYIITGLLDSSAVFIWGSFVSMQTGNTIYLGLGLVKPKSGDRWLTSLLSIGSFCLGSFFFSRFHRFFSPRRRWVMVASFTIQFLLIVVSALIVSLGPDADNGLHWQVLVPLAAVAFQSSGQAVTSRVLEHNGMTSVVLTSTYCDLFSDPELLTTSLFKNADRNRKLAAPLLLLLGAFCGGAFANSDIGLQGALWAAAALKAVVIGAWLFWSAESEEEDEDE